MTVVVTVVALTVTTVHSWAIDAVSPSMVTEWSADSNRTVPMRCG